MPIRPEMRERYPKDWKLRSRFVRFVRARGRCEWCGVEHGALGYRRDGEWHALPVAISQASIDPTKRGDIIQCSDGSTVRIVQIILTTAHVYDDRPEASGLLNLAALCQKCHNDHDAKARRAGTRERAIAARKTVDMFTASIR